MCLGPYCNPPEEGSESSPVPEQKRHRSIASRFRSRKTTKKTPTPERVASPEQQAPAHEGDEAADTLGFEPTMTDSAANEDWDLFTRENLRTIFDDRGTSTAIIMAMLTMPEDGKPDNYVCAKADEGKLRIVCVDNDHAFVPADGNGAVRRSWHGRDVSSRVKCVLFCLDQMHDQVDASVYEALTRADFVILDFVEAWLASLERVHQAHTAMEELFSSAGTRSKYE